MASFVCCYLLPVLRNGTVLIYVPETLTRVPRQGIVYCDGHPVHTCTVFPLLTSEVQLQVIPLVGGIGCLNIAPYHL